MEIIELYEFTVGNPLYIYKYTSAATTVSPGGAWGNYEPMVIERSDIKTTSALSGNTVSFYIGIDEPLASNLLYNPHEAVGSVTIRRLINGVVSNLYKGALKSVGVQNGVITITCSDILGDTSNPLNINFFTRNCRHMLYSKSCGVTREDQRVAINIMSYNTQDRTVIFSAIGAPFAEPDHFIGGYVEPGFHIVQIEGLGTPTEPFSAKIADIGVGRISVGPTYAYPGCDRTPATCRGKFDNLPNYGGFPLSDNVGE